LDDFAERSRQSSPARARPLNAGGAVISGRRLPRGDDSVGVATDSTDLPAGVVVSMRPPLVVHVQPAAALSSGQRPSVEGGRATAPIREAIADARKRRTPQRCELLSSDFEDDRRALPILPVRRQSRQTAGRWARSMGNSPRRRGHERHCPRGPSAVAFSSKGDPCHLECPSCDARGWSSKAAIGRQGDGSGRFIRDAQ